SQAAIPYFSPEPDSKVIQVVADRFPVFFSSRSIPFFVDKLTSASQSISKIRTRCQSYPFLLTVVHFGKVPPKHGQERQIRSGNFTFKPVYIGPVDKFHTIFPVDGLIPLIFKFEVVPLDTQA